MIDNERTAVHFAPHPDDELIGAPATLMSLRDAGWSVINVACGLGRPQDEMRRLGELEDACRRAKFELVVPDGLPGIGGEDDLDIAQAGLAAVVSDVLASHNCQYVVSPSPHDGHHGHEVVARAVRDALENTEPTRWAMWGLWSDLSLPNIYVPFTSERLDEITEALQAHAGEVDRNDYVGVVESRGRMNAIVGVERVFGFGAVGHSARYAELLTEVTYTGDDWLMSPPRIFEAMDCSVGTGPSLGWWLHRESDRGRWRRELSAPRCS